MSGLEFTKDAARRLESQYLTRDMVAQRAETIRRLALSRVSRVLSEAFRVVKQGGRTRYDRLWHITSLGAVQRDVRS